MPTDPTPDEVAAAEALILDGYIDSDYAEGFARTIARHTRLAEREAEIKRLGAQYEDLMELKKQVDSQLTEAQQKIERLKIKDRYGTPFDPTGAKTGTEINSLRQRLDEAQRRLRETCESALACGELRFGTNALSVSIRTKLIEHIESTGAKWSAAIADGGESDA